MLFPLPVPPISAMCSPSFRVRESPSITFFVESGYAKERSRISIANPSGCSPSPSARLSSSGLVRTSFRRLADTFTLGSHASVQEMLISAPEIMPMYCKTAITPPAPMPAPPSARMPPIKMTATVARFKSSIAKGSTIPPRVFARIIYFAISSVANFARPCSRFSLLKALTTRKPERRSRTILFCRSTYLSDLSHISYRGRIKKSTKRRTGGMESIKTADSTGSAKKERAAEPMNIMGTVKSV